MHWDVRAIEGGANQRDLPSHAVDEFGPVAATDAQALYTRPEDAAFDAQLGGPPRAGRPRDEVHGLDARDILLRVGERAL
ncbi:hypothetical protein [Microbacterium sp. YJN-G]|uniref:hypothetical protein n=1 Tax=Microbacterium sp. YJN-G TaxID=2763257 RepID=UPI001878230A|nr:hypothetical protein [Microbacterium sp. YJN-G]